MNAKELNGIELSMGSLVPLPLPKMYIGRIVKQLTRKWREMPEKKSDEEGEKRVPKGERVRETEGGLSVSQ